MRHVLILATFGSAVAVSSLAAAPHPPIAVEFTLGKPGHVTLTIENRAGNRVRNLVMDRFFPAGRHTAWWDGMTDHSQQNIRPHGGYDVVGTQVDPGEYTVRGIVHDPIDLVYQFTPYMPGNRPWRTADRGGQWLSDHTPPCSILFLPGNPPQILIGSTLAEGAHALVWTDAEGRKIQGVTNIGITYTGVSKLTRPTGKSTLPFVAYGVGVGGDGSQLGIVGITADRKTVQLYYDSSRKLLPEKAYTFDYSPLASGFSLTVHGDAAAVSVPALNKILLIDLGTGRKRGGNLIGELDLPSPYGLVYDEQGSLYALSANQLRKLKLSGGKIANDTVVIPKLDEPRDVLLHGGRLYISCRGGSHQIKVFDLSGRRLRSVGKPGKPKLGPYDETKMQNPQGAAVDDQGRLWVAEEDYHPKRVSIWDKNGRFVRAIYGPTEYGGGGRLDPRDKTKFYYAGMEFKLDWAKGEDAVVNIYARDDLKSRDLPPHRIPDYPVRLGKHRYFTNTYNGDPVHGPPIGVVYRMNPDGSSAIVAALGQASLWDALTKEPLRATVPPKISTDRKAYGSGYHDKPHWNRGEHGLFAWSDLNDDGKVQPRELTFCLGKAIGFNQKPDSLDFIAADGTYIAPARFTASGVPVYDLAKAEKRWQGKAMPYSQLIPGSDGKAFALTQYAPEIAEVNRIAKWAGGAVTGKTADGRTWFYPNRWSGLHASQLYPTNREPESGELIGMTKMIGPTMTIGPDKLGVFAFYANSGSIYLLTVDGFFVAKLFKHGFFSKKIGNTALTRGMILNEYTSDGEGFYQTMTRYPDGKVYVQALNHTSSLVEVQGIDSLRRLPDSEISVTRRQLEAGKEYYVARERERQRQSGTKSMVVKLGGEAPVIDGKPDDWSDAQWVRIDDRIEAAIKVGGGRLFAAWRTNVKDIARNSGANPLFKSGGALDLMLAAKPDRKGEAAVEGDQRLLVALVAGKPRVQLHEPKSKKAGSPGSVSSPHRTIHFDFMGDVTGKVRFAQGKCSPYWLRTKWNRGRFRMVSQGGFFYELSVSLRELGLAPVDGMKIRADIGALTGDGTSTQARLYWNNKGTSQLFDAPDESILRPTLWGEVEFRSIPGPKAGGLNRKVFISPTGGKLPVDSTAFDKGKPTATIDWDGSGDTIERAVGSKGCVLFRFQPKGWFDSDTRAALSPPFALPGSLKPGGKDGMAFAMTPFHYRLTLDGKAAGHQTGARLGGSWEHKHRASWDFGGDDGKPHRITVIAVESGPDGELKIEDKGDWKTVYRYGGDRANATMHAHVISVIQFEVVGKVHLRLEQKPFQRGEKRDAVPGIAAVFFD